MINAFVFLALNATQACAISGPELVLESLRAVSRTLTGQPAPAITVPAADVFAVPGSGLPPIDASEAGEAFSHFFERITRGGRFPGIRLDAPSAVQAAFLPRIRQANWVGSRNKEQRVLADAGVDLWFDWYKEQAPVRLLFPDDAAAAAFRASLGKALRREGSGMAVERFYATPWETLGRGLDLSIRSAEALMVLEGMAEHDALTALKNAGRTAGVKNPLPLFAAEHAMETVLREGNGQTGQLFPYTVGLPFAAALHDAAPGRRGEIFESMLRVMASAVPLPDALRALFGRP